MPFLTNEDIQERKAAGVKMNRLNMGWNLSPKKLLKAAKMIEDFHPKTEAEKRDKHILQLAFIEDMNSQQIARLNDPLIVGMGNRSRGKPLSPTSILEICYKYFPDAKQRKYKGCQRDKHSKERNALYLERRKNNLNRPKICSTCGSKESIELHHIIPLIVGGTNEYFNLIFLCHDCHMRLHHELYDKLGILEKEKK